MQGCATWGRTVVVCVRAHPVGVVRSATSGSTRVAVTRATTAATVPTPATAPSSASVQSAGAVPRVDTALTRAPRDRVSTVGAVSSHDDRSSPATTVLLPFTFATGVRQSGSANADAAERKLGKSENGAAADGKKASNERDDVKAG